MQRDDGVLIVTPGLGIPMRELDFRATPGGGPGGQHVNRSATRVELWWDVTGSPSLTDRQRALLLERLGPRLDRTGRLRLVSGARRSQAMNRAAVLERFVAVVGAALYVARPRKPTRPTRAAVERRLEAKRQRARTKAERRRRGEDD